MSFSSAQKAGGSDEIRFLRIYSHPTYFDTKWFIDGVICVHDDMVIFWWSCDWISASMSFEESRARVLVVAAHCLADANKCVPLGAAGSAKMTVKWSRTKGFDLFKSNVCRLHARPMHESLNKTTYCICRGYIQHARSILWMKSPHYFQLTDFDQMRVGEPQCFSVLLLLPWCVVSLHRRCASNRILHIASRRWIVYLVGRIWIYLRIFINEKRIKCDAEKWLFATIHVFGNNSALNGAWLNISYGIVSIRKTGRKSTYC